jgi:hypothetical protein
MKPGSARLGLVLTLVLCGSADGQKWSVQRVAGIGESTGQTFGRISSMTVAPDGRLFVLDGLESRVHVFSAAGESIRSFGRRGAGPGELSNLATEVLLSRGQLVVVDAMNQRISLFGDDGTFIRSRPLNMLQGMPMAWAAANDRLVYLARPMPGPVTRQMGGITQHTVFALDPRADTAPDTLLRVDLPPDHDVILGPTLKIKVNMRVPQLRLAGDGGARVLLASTDTYHIRVLNAGGTTTGWLTRATPRHRYTSAELARKKQQADSTMQVAFKTGVAASAGGRGVPRPEVEYILPEYAPVLTGMLAGDRFVLVQRNSEADREPTDWDILSYDGRLMGTFRLPASFRALAFSGDRIYGIEKDELDVESIAVYRIAPR